MADISNLRVCKNCKNVFSNAVGGMRSPSTPCPVCKSYSSEAV